MLSPSDKGPCAIHNWPTPSLSGASSLEYAFGFFLEHTDREENGGVATALSSLACHLPLLWCAGMGISFPRLFMRVGKVLPWAEVYT